MENDSQDQNQYINLNAVRREDQRAVMAEIAKQEHCPFCLENLEKYHKNPILKQGKFWLLTENQWPYEKIKHQLLAIYKTHIEHLSEMDPEAGKELIEIFAEETKKRNIEGGGVAIRFGKSEFGNYGSSVLHVHAHLIEPDLQALGETEAWRFKFGQPKNYRKQK
ncbi:MAG: HIT domain-containing protein [Patescibacteria group bacterium]